MKPLTNALKKMLNGLAHADAGEYLTPRQKSAYLQDAAVNVVNSDDPAPVLAENAVKNTRRRVAMYMGSTLPAKMMDYVLETCTSLDHDLTVLTFETSAVSSALLEPYTKTLEESGIALETVKLSGEPIPGLARYLRAQGAELSSQGKRDGSHRERASPALLLGGLRPQRRLAVSD